MIRLILFCLMISLSAKECAKRGKKDLVNVKKFGAVGDGKTNDALAFQKAIKHAEAKNKTLFLPKGRYAIKSRQLNKFLKITVPVLGEGMDQSIIEIHKPLKGTYAPGIALQGKNLTLAQLSIVGNKSLATVGSSVLVLLLENEKLKFQQVRIDGNHTKAHGIELVRDVNGFTFRNGQIQNCQLGLFKTNKRVSTQRNITFEQSTFKDIVGECLAFNSPAHMLHLKGRKGKWTYRDKITGQRSKARFSLVNPGTAHSTKVINQDQLKMRWLKGKFIPGEKITNEKGASAMVDKINQSTIENVIVKDCTFTRSSSINRKKAKAFGVDLAHVLKAQLVNNTFEGSFKEAYHIEDGSEQVEITGGSISLESADARGIRIYSPSRFIHIRDISIAMKKGINVKGKIGIDYTSKPVKDHGEYQITNVEIKGFEKGIYLDSSRQGGNIENCSISDCHTGIFINPSPNLNLKANNFSTCNTAITQNKGAEPVLNKNKYDKIKSNVKKLK